MKFHHRQTLTILDRDDNPIPPACSFCGKPERLCDGIREPDVIEIPKKNVILNSASSFDEVNKWFAKRGFKEYPSPSYMNPEAMITRCYEGPKIGGLQCEDNDKYPTLHVQIWNIPYYSKIEVQFNVYGKYDNLAFKFDIYSIQASQMTDELLQNVMNKAHAAWVAFCIH